jgi:hypothetical protein
VLALGTGRTGRSRVEGRPGFPLAWSVDAEVVVAGVPPRWSRRIPASKRALRSVGGSVVRARETPAAPALEVVEVPAAGCTG